jgi:hypothetical protein
MGDKVGHWIIVFAGFSLITYLGFRKQDHSDNANIGNRRFAHFYKSAGC